MLIYNATQFPQRYRGGAFIAFHGSWNRAPGPQGGYNIVFQPLANGKATGPYIVFADGFAGAVKQPGQAAFRPTGLAVGPDGALFISDDMHGRIWRVVYKGTVRWQAHQRPRPASHPHWTPAASKHRCRRPAARQRRRSRAEERRLPRSSRVKTAERLGNYPVAQWKSIQFH